MEELISVSVFLRVSVFLPDWENTRVHSQQPPPENFTPRWWFTQQNVCSYLSFLGGTSSRALWRFVHFQSHRRILCLSEKTPTLLSIKIRLLRSPFHFTIFYFSLRPVLPVAPMIFLLKLPIEIKPSVVCQSSHILHVCILIVEQICQTEPSISWRILPLVVSPVLWPKHALPPLSVWSSSSKHKMPIPRLNPVKSNDTRYVNPLYSHPFSFLLSHYRSYSCRALWIVLLV